MSHEMRALTAVGAFVFCTAVAACGGAPSPAPSSPAAPAAVTSIAVLGTTGFTSVGQQLQFIAAATLSDGTTQNVSASASWQSSNSSVLSVSPTGMGTSVTEGDAKI